LSQLLGGNSAELDQFVENVCRHQKGEPLVVVGEETQSTSHQDQETSNAKNAAVSDSIPQQKPQNSKASAALESRRYKQNHQGKKSRVPPPKSSTSNNSRKSPPPSSRTVGNSTGNQISKQQSNSSTTNPTVAAESPPASGQQSPSDRVVQKSHPKRGKAKKVCGCFGTKHNPLTNCLYCGRISCELEGYDFCAFCGYMVEEIKAEAYVQVAAVAARVVDCICVGT
jgi:Putative zinc finger motif, C2HC5-type